MKSSKQLGFALMDVVMGVVVCGLVVVPFFKFLAEAERVKELLWARAMEDGWRVLPVQALALGVDPERLFAFADEDADLARAMANHPMRVERKSLPKMPWQPELESVRAFVGDSWPMAWGLVAGRLVTGPAGGEWGLSAAMRMPEPLLVPASGSTVALAQMRPALDGMPATLQVRASVPDGAGDCAVIVEFLGTRFLAGSSEVGLDCADLAAGVVGRAWAEWSGAGEAIALPLGDGRKAWLVREGPSWRRYDPSGFVPVSYRVDVGSPTLHLRGDFYESGAQVEVSYPVLMEVRAGGGFGVIWPESVRAAFGDRWEEVEEALALNCRIGSTDVAGGDFSWAARDANLGVWSDVTRVSARIWGESGGLMASEGEWMLLRRPVEMSAPQLVGAPYLYYAGRDTHAVRVTIESGTAFGAVQGRVEAGGVLSPGVVLELDLP
jgi:hypothetical protein